MSRRCHHRSGTTWPPSTTTNASAAASVPRPVPPAPLRCGWTTSWSRPSPNSRTPPLDLHYPPRQISSYKFVLSQHPQHPVCCGCFLCDMLHFSSRYSKIISRPYHCCHLQRRFLTGCHKKSCIIYATYQGRFYHSFCCSAQKTQSVFVLTTECPKTLA